MTPRRALWEAVATVCIPPILIWGFLLYVIRANARADEWPVYIVFVALPLPLIHPVYKRYLCGRRANEENPRALFITAFGFFIVGALNIASGALSLRDRWHTAYQLFLGILWLLLSAERLRRWTMVRRALADRG